jgi:hypothetical protein
MHGPKSTHRAEKNVPPAIRAIVNLRDGGSDRYDGRGVGTHIDHHHRQLRSQGPRHTPGNLVSLFGSGTTGNHGLMHRRPERATHLGFIVPSYIDDPADVPIRLASRYGKRGWAMLTDAGDEHPVDPGLVVRIMRDLGIWGPTETWL